MRFSVKLLAIHVLFNASCTALTYTNQFAKWYPQYGLMFAKIRRENCSEQYERYLTGNKSHQFLDEYGTGGNGPYSILTQPVVLCLLENTNEYVKGAMTSAQVLLGIMPTVLALLGSSAEETAMLANVARRPLLALLLSAGSPSVYVSRAFEYHDPETILSISKNRMKHTLITTRWKIAAVSLVEYCLAVAAVGNVATMSWQLGTRTVCNWWTDSIIGPAMWAAVGVLVHISGTVSLRLRIRGIRIRQPDATCTAEPSGDDTPPPRLGQRVKFRVERLFAWFLKVPKRVMGIVGETELYPSASADFVVQMDVSKDSRPFLFIEWCKSTFTIAHIIFGTIIFSSLTFIGPEDAIKLFARYLSSVIVCRILLMWELAGLRQVLADTIDTREAGDKEEEDTSSSVRAVREQAPQITFKDKSWPT